MRILITCLCFFVLTAPAYADYKEAAHYSATASGIAMVVMKDGKVVFENYVNGGHKNKTVELYSGTKSFSGVIAAAAVQDGLLSLDEKASDTLIEWQSDPKKKNITIRQILSLTSGIDTTRPGKYPTYENAIKLQMDTRPGEAFEYGPANFQIFGEIMQRKLKNYKGGMYKNPAAYLQKRVLDPISVRPKNWDIGDDDLPILSMGADLSARHWATFGQFVLQGGQWNGRQLVDKQALTDNMKGSSANAAYGLTWWLNKKPSAQTLKKSRMMKYSSDLFTNKDARKIPEDMFMAAGFRDQRLYVIPSKNMVIVRQTSGKRNKFFDKWKNRDKLEIKQTEKFSDTLFLLKALDL